MPDRGAHEPWPCQVRQTDETIYKQSVDNNEGLVGIAFEGTAEEQGTETMDGDGGGSYRHIRMLDSADGKARTAACGF
jgi:hypothetical protein